MGFTSSSSPRSVRDAMFLSPTSTVTGSTAVTMDMAGTLKLKTLNEDGLYSWETRDYILTNVGADDGRHCWLLRNSSNSKQVQEESLKGNLRDIFLSEVVSVECRGGAGCRFDLRFKNGTSMSFLTIDSNDCTQWVNCLSPLVNNVQVDIPKTTESLDIDTGYESEANVEKHSSEELQIHKRNTKTAVVPSHTSRRLVQKKKKALAPSTKSNRSRLTRPTTSSSLKAGTRRLRSSSSIRINSSRTSSKAKTFSVISKPKVRRTQRTEPVGLSKKKKIKATTPVSRVSRNGNTGSASPAANNSRSVSKPPLQRSGDEHMLSITNEDIKEQTIRQIRKEKEKGKHPEFIGEDVLSEQLMKLEALRVQERAKYTRELKDLQKALVLESQRCEELRNELCEMAEKRVEDQVTIASLSRKLQSQNL
mmetsp:Transcript_9476/g.10983  ORF Transcript_9476/g.10983 Transcript_9476/m.10983 type:complete len:421 (+) Transcript_9476:198-1460(+)